MTTDTEALPLLTEASFEGATEAEVKAKVEAWAREQFAKVVGAMKAAFRA